MTILEPGELITILETDALTVFTTMEADGKTPAGIVPYLDRVQEFVDAFETPSMETEAGRDRLNAFTRRITKAKTAIEGIGAKLAKEQKEIPNKIDASRRLAKAKLEALHDKVRKPLTDWEAAEEKRVNGHNEAVRWMLGLVGSVAGRDSSALRTDLEAVEAVVVDASTCQEFADQYAGARAQALEALTGALERALQDEADKAELARLRAAEAQRKADEAEAAAAKQREAEQEAERKRQEDWERTAEQRGRAKAEEALRIERERQEREQADEAKRLAAEEAKRAADVEHRRSVNRAALDGLTGSGVPADIAKQVLTMIIEGKVPHVRISY